MNSLFQMFESTWAIVAILLGFGFLIFVHELGHFLAAKAVGIKVTQFAIGFGQAMVAWRRGIGFRRGTTEVEYQKNIDEGADEDLYGETEYRLNWMPLGGYVKMLGQEDMNPEAVSDDERSFGKKPAWARAIVISAGVIMNLIFGMVFFVIAFMAGVEFPPAVVGHVVPDSVAAQAYAVGHENQPDYRGLRAGDQVVRIDGEQVVDFADVVISSALAGLGDTLELEVQRDGEDNLLLYRMTPKLDKNTNLLALGIGRPMSLEIAKFKSGRLPKILRDTEVKSGMRVVSVDGHPVERYDQYERAVVNADGQPVQVGFSVDSESSAVVEVPVQAELLLDYGDKDEPTKGHLAGLMPATGIAGVLEDSPAQKAGLLAGDLLAQIGSASWPGLEEVGEEVQQSGSKGVHVSVLRDGKIVDLGNIKPGRGKRIGIEMEIAYGSAVVRDTIAGSAISNLNLNRGSKILSIDGQAVSNYGEIQRALSHAVENRDDELSLNVAIGYQLNIANSEPEVGQLVVDAGVASSLGRTSWLEPLAGSPFRTPVFKLLVVPISATSPMAATRMGLRKTHQFMLQTYLTVARLFQGTVKPEHLRGPVGITNEGSRIAKQGTAYLMFFLGLISVNLAVINFLPIPIVDGGLMVMLIIEKLKGSPVSPRIQSAVSYIGLALIGTVFLLTTYYDVMRLFPS